MINKMISRKILIILFVTLFSLAGVSQGSSAFFAPAAGYRADDFITTSYIDTYDVAGNQVFAWAENTLSIYDRSGNLTLSLGTPPAGYSDSTHTFNSFVKKDPSANALWVGFTTDDGSGDDRIYQYDLTNSAWDHKATLPGNFDIDFSSGNVFVSATNDTGFTGTSKIWLLDTTGTDAHDQIADIGGYSAGLAFDSSGNLLYATSGLVDGLGTDDNKILRYTAQQVSSAIGATALLFNDADILADIAGGAYDTAVDEADNILFSANSFSTGASYAGIWNETTMDYDLIGTGAGPLGDWFSMIDAEGDITGRGSFFQVDGAAAWFEVPPGSGNWVSERAYTGIAEITTVPEPTTLALLGWGGFWLKRRRK
jgi:hypothetical protein